MLIGFLELTSNEIYRRIKNISIDTKKFIERIENITNIPVTLIGTGEKNCDIIDLRDVKLKAV